MPKNAHKENDAAEPSGRASRASALALATRPEGAAVKGILCVLASGLIGIVQDVITKWMTGFYPPGEVIFWRSICTFVPLAFFVWRAGGLGVLRTTRPGAHAARAFFSVTSTVVWVFGLALLPMTEAFTATFTGPLFVTALAAPLLGESIGWRRWAAVGVGFAGVVVMLKPDATGVQLAILLPVASALLGAFRDIATRRLTQGENTVAILAYATAALALTGLASLPFGWKSLSPFDFALFFAAGLIMGFSQLFMIQAFRYAEAATVVPFKYATLVWATAAGFLVFGDVPDRAIVLGALLIVGSGLYIFHREAGRRCSAKVE